MVPKTSLATSGSRLRPPDQVYQHKPQTAARSRTPTSSSGCGLWTWSVVLGCTPHHQVAPAVRDLVCGVQQGRHAKFSFVDDRGSEPRSLTMNFACLLPAPRNPPIDSSGESIGAEDFLGPDIQSFHTFGVSCYSLNSKVHRQVRLSRDLTLGYTLRVEMVTA